MGDAKDAKDDGAGGAPLELMYKFLAAVSEERMADALKLSTQSEAPTAARRPLIAPRDPRALSRARSFGARTAQYHGAGIRERFEDGGRRRQLVGIER